MSVMKMKRNLSKIKSNELSFLCPYKNKQVLTDFQWNQEQSLTLTSIFQADQITGRNHARKGKQDLNFHRNKEKGR